MASETCERCGREKAESMRAWNTAEHERFMAAPVGEDSDDALGPAQTCGRHLTGQANYQTRKWDCDRATIARLKAENERIKARLVGVLDYSGSLAAASAENADRLERELAEAKGRVAELETEPSCWHCKDVLIADPRPTRCERCPDECDDEDCQAEGCTEARALLATPPAP